MKLLQIIIGVLLVITFLQKSQKSRMEILKILVIMP